MSNGKISNNEAIEAALNLNGEPERVKEFYEDWAKNYNIDTDDADYIGPSIAARLLSQHLSVKNSRTLDAGCGTGLVGIELQELGYINVDGFDLSDSMVELAAATGAYRQVLGSIDMMRATESYPAASYDAVLSVGVFTLGHVPPEALNVLLRLTKAGGLLLISTRTHYYDQTNFQQVVDELTTSQHAELIQLIKDAPYNNDGDGHYWVFRKSG